MGDDGLTDFVVTANDLWSVFVPERFEQSRCQRGRGVRAWPAGLRSDPKASDIACIGRADVLESADDLAAWAGGLGQC
jgi:hypothetical protein